MTRGARGFNIAPLFLKNQQGLKLDLSINLNRYEVKQNQKYGVLMSIIFSLIMA